MKAVINIERNGFIIQQIDITRFIEMSSIAEGGSIIRFELDYDSIEEVCKSYINKNLELIIFVEK